MARIHIFGASGSGVTTLGNLLSQCLSIPAFDTDDFYWKPTDPPYVIAHPIEERIKLLQSQLEKQNDWIISGSMDSWSHPFVPLFQLAIYLDVPTSIRVKRLKQREKDRYGKRILPGGDMHHTHQYFVTWAQQYDHGHLPGRNRQRHETWTKTLPCPVLRIEGDYSTQETALFVQEKLIELGIV